MKVVITQSMLFSWVGILEQVCSINSKADLTKMHRISFAQKTYLAIILIDLYEINAIAFDRGGCVFSILTNPRL